ncbi:MAG: hypothetical protein KDD47_23730 [Acidobacteria bacterium]|nr:hypothetical protein [Acidobacteriota bacterium]
MKKTSMPYAGRALVAVLLAAGLMAAGPVMAQNCVDFQGINHCPVGQAALDVAASGNGLIVSGLGSEGNDGVASRFAPTVHWNAMLQVPTGSASQSFDLSSISGGESTSGLIVEPKNGRYRVKATFTGASEASTYSVLVYRDGVLQGALGGFSGDPNPPAQGGGKASTGLGLRNVSQQIALYVDGFYMGEIEDPWWIWLFDFSISSNGGGCNWGIALASAVSVSLPDGSELEGDEIRIQEEVRGDGHYPYLGFESIEIRGTSDSFAIRQELAEGSG